MCVRYWVLLGRSGEGGGDGTAHWLAAEPLAKHVVCPPLIER